MKSVIAWLLMVTAALCQTDDPQWRRVTNIGADQTIRIDTVDKRHEGVLVSASATAVVIDVQHDAPQVTQLTVPRSEVVRVYTRSKSHRVRNTAIGTAVGAAIGITLYMTLGTLFRNEGADGTEVWVGGTTAAGAGLGAIVPTGRWKKVYDSKQRR